MNLWIYFRFFFFLNGRLIPIWCFSEYLGQQVGLCMGLFHSYIVFVHHNPAESYSAAGICNHFCANEERIQVWPAKVSKPRPLRTNHRHPRVQVQTLRVPPLPQPLHDHCLSAEERDHRRWMSIKSTVVQHSQLTGQQMDAKNKRK